MTEPVSLSLSALLLLPYFQPRAVADAPLPLSEAGAFARAFGCGAHFAPSGGSVSWHLALTSTLQSCRQLFCLPVAKHFSIYILPGGVCDPCGLSTGALGDLSFAGFKVAVKRGCAITLLPVARLCTHKQN